MKNFITINIAIIVFLGASGCAVQSSSPYAYNCQGIDADMRCKNS